MRRLCCEKGMNALILKLLGEDLTYQGIECQGQLASMLRALEGVSDFL